MESKNKYRFYKEGKRWYVDLPDWPGDKSNLEMVAGADEMLDLFADGEKEVTLLISEEVYDGADSLVMKEMAVDIGEGAYYIMQTFNGKEIGLEMWICGVCEWVFGKFPPVLYISKNEVSV